MVEELVGWIASQSLGRLSYRAYKGGYGYGLFFTSDHLIGVSHKSIVSKVLRPAYALAVFGFALLGTLLTYFYLDVPRPPPVNQPEPWWVILLTLVMFGSWIASLVFLLYVCPKKIARLIQHEASSSVKGPWNQASGLLLDRSNISQVYVERFQISIQTISDEWFLFRVQSPRAWAVREQVIGLFQKFCSLSPQINMFIKQKKQWIRV